MNNLLRLIVLGALLVFAVLMIGLGLARNVGDLSAPVHLLLFFIAIALYLFPAALAYHRDCEAVVWIAIVNVFLGWTIFGWFVSIGWAAAGKARTGLPAIPTHPVPSH